jgi:phage shock protein PspC (stress-responsive transcriptional regulator)
MSTDMKDNDTTTGGGDNGSHGNGRPDWRHTPVSRMPKGVPDGGKLGGVVSGLSRAYGFDLRTTRIATVVALFVLPPLWLVYIAAWVLLPDTPAEAQPIDAVLRDRRRRPLMVVLAALLVMAVLGSFGSWFLFDGAPWGAVLIGVGVLLWASTTGRFAQRSATSAGTIHVPARPDGTFPPPHVDDTTVTATLSGSTITAQQPTIQVDPMPRRVRRPITSIGVGVMVLWFAIVGVGNGLDKWNTQDLWIIVVGMAIVLTAMLASIVVNRSWVLPFLFFPLLAVMVALCIAQPNLDGSGGDRTVIPSTVAEAEARQLISTGTMTIDLTNVSLGTTPLQVDAEVGMGRLQVLVPENVDVVLLTDVGMGQAQVDGVQIDAGVRQTNRRTIDASSPPDSSGQMVLDLRVGMGQIDVRLVASGS